MRKLILALGALAVAVPAHAEPKVRALKEVYAAGFKDCAPAMEKFVQFVHDDDASYSFVGKYALEQTNDSSAAALTVQRFSDGQGVASITGTKTSAGKCDVVLTHTLVFPTETCDTLRTTAFKDWKLYMQMHDSNVYQDPTVSTGHAVLSPMGTVGCLVVKHLMGFGI